MPAKTVIKHRQGAASLWLSTNPVLASGEWGYESDTKKVKIGDGSTAWNLLSHLVGLPIGGTTGQILAKSDNEDYAVQWIDNSAPNIEQYVKNTTGSNIPIGTPVYISGATGDTPLISVASNDTEMESSKVIGLTKTAIANDGFGYVITEGILNGVNTDGLTAGTVMWLGVDGAIVFGTPKPVAPAHLVFLGYVIRIQSNNGSYFIKPQNGYELDELHNILIGTKANNDLLAYESSTGLWKNKTFSALDLLTVTTANSTYATLTTSQTLTNKTLGSGTVLGANLNANSNKITGLATPTADTDAANKAYVDAATSGLNVHDSVKAATTPASGNINLSTGLVNGTVIDGVTLATGNRVLVKNQSTVSQNGVYIVAASGAASRATDYDATPEVDAGDFIFVENGTVNGKTGWIQTNTIVTIGSDPIDFTQFSGAGTYAAGNGLSLTGTTFSINTGVTVDLNTSQTLTNKIISGSSNTISNIANSSLTNPSITIGSTSISLGSTASTLSGLTSVSATTFTGSLTGNISGNAATVTNGVYTTGSYANPSWITSLASSKVGATTVGNNLITLTNPSAITFLRINADNTVSALSDVNFRTAIGAGTPYTLPAATSTVLGGIELFSDTVQSTAANAITTTASRTYGLQLNAAGQGVINVPWTDTVYTLPAATSTVRGGIELFSDTAQTVAANAVSTTASRTYGIQVNADGQAVVNVPWVDTDTNTVTRLQGTGGTLVSGDVVVQGTGLVSTSQSGNTITIATTATNNTGTVTSVVAGNGLSGGTITTSGTIAVEVPTYIQSTAPTTTATKYMWWDTSGENLTLWIEDGV